MPLAHKDPKLPPPLALPDDATWTDAIPSLGATRAETLVAVLRTLCPHDAVPLVVYRRAAVALAAFAHASPATRTKLDDLLVAVDADFPVPFAQRSEGYRVAALKALDGTPAFVFVQRHAVRFVYDDRDVWDAFGYEGAAVHLGGYVERGFDDLDWLPPVPPEVCGGLR